MIKNHPGSKFTKKKLFGDIDQARIQKQTVQNPYSSGSVD